jgi:hypothetical protein
MKRLRMLRRRATRRAEVGAQDQRGLQLAARHVVGLRRLIAELVHRQEQEVAEHQIDDRPRTRHRGADRNSHEAGFGDRCVDNSLASEFLHQPREDLERGPRFRDVLADHEDRRIAPHLLGDGLVDGCGQSDLPHRHLRPPFRRRRASRLLRERDKARQAHRPEPPRSGREPPRRSPAAPRR